MNKEIEKGLVPNLRFPEFVNWANWKTDKLSNLIFTLTPPQKLPTSLYQIEGLYPIIDQSQSYICGWTDDKNALISENLPLIIFGDHTCVLKMVRVPFAQGADGIKIIKTNEKIEVGYLYQFLQFNPVVTEEYKRHFSILKEKFIFFPTKESGEQTKIAACLSSLDDLITAQTQKIEALKTHKKGLMQQLFPQEGETVPKLRFPEFSGDWVETTLGRIAKYENGKAHEQDIVELGKFIVVNSKFISTDGEVKKFTNVAFCLAEKEDILIVLSDIPNGRAIAKCFFVGTDNLYTVNQRICKITPIKAVSMMLFYLLNRNSYFLAFDDGVKQTNLKKDDVLNCPILLPKDSKEQQKIADCLSSLDDLINAHVKKCELLKTHKKGLMQGLFPVAGEK